MRNFDLSEHPGKYKRWSYFFSAGICIDWVSCSEINIIPYRPKSGKNRGMKNTFLFTMDNIQVIARMIQDQSKSLWSRSRKPTTSCSTPRSFPHPGSKSPCGAGALFFLLFSFAGQVPFLSFFAGQVPFFLFFGGGRCLFLSFFCGLGVFY